MARIAADSGKLTSGTLKGAIWTETDGKTQQKTNEDQQVFGLNQAMRFTQNLKEYAGVEILA